MNDSNQKINPIYSYLANILIKLIFKPVEIQKTNLNLQSYIFAPNHSNNIDGYLIWALLSQKFNLDTFMFKEFWDNYPIFAKLLQSLHVYPLTRDRVKLSEIKDELKRLESEYQSLLIFPDGRHVDPEIIHNFKEFHENTIPLGAFYLAALSNKPILPIFLEPQIPFKENLVIYGNPIWPSDFNINPNKKLEKKCLLELSRAWLNEINESYLKAKSFLDRPLHPYKIQKCYTDSSGINYGELQDPNVIINYLRELEILMKNNIPLTEATLKEISNKTLLEEEKLAKILTLKNLYEQHLLRRQ